MQDQSNRVCTTCGVNQPLSEFYIKKNGGKILKCRTCCRAYSRQWRQDHPEQHAEHVRRWRARYPEKSRAMAKRGHTLHPERARESAARWRQEKPDRARMADRGQHRVAYAIKTGRLIRPNTCEQCGTSGVRIFAAHHDYSKPLAVRWLCGSCHAQWDHASPKTI